MVEVVTRVRDGSKASRQYSDLDFNGKPFSHWYREILRTAKRYCKDSWDESEYPVIYSRAFHDGVLFLTVIVSEDTIIIKHFFGRTGYSVISYRRKEHFGV